MTSELVHIHTNQIARSADGCISNLVGAPPPSKCIFAASIGESSIFTVELVFANGTLAAQLEAVTSASAVSSVIEYMRYDCTASSSEIQKRLRNEVITQTTPEKQMHYSNSKVVCAGYAFTDFLSLCGNEAEWEGDRQLTFKYEFLDLDDFLRVVGNSMRGWIIAPHYSRNGAASKRTKLGDIAFLLPFFHNDKNGSNTNCITYCLEKRLLEVRLSLGLFTDNLEWKSGAPPPDRIAGLLAGPLAGPVVPRKQRGSENWDSSDDEREEAETVAAAANNSSTKFKFDPVDRVYVDATKGDAFVVARGLSSFTQTAAATRGDDSSWNELAPPDFE